MLAQGLRLASSGAKNRAEVNIFPKTIPIFPNGKKPNICGLIAGQFFADLN